MMANLATVAPRRVIQGLPKLPVGNEDELVAVEGYISSSKINW